MKPQDVLAHRATVLSDEQRCAFFDQGFLVLPDYVPQAWLHRLRAAMAELLDRSRAVTQSDSIYVLEEGHSRNTPRLHRVSSPQDQHAVFWEFFTDPVMTDLAADVVGPDVKFHHAKLNVKSGKGSQGFGWHQDIPAWPHTDFSPVTIGVYIDGCTDQQGPLTVAEGSHAGPLFSMYDDSGNFVVKIRDKDLRWLTDDKVRTITGGPGTTLLLNCRVVHGSSPNRASAARPLLLPVYSSADSFAYTPSPIPSPHQGDIVRGQPARFASFDTRPVEMPPDWRFGYKPVWAHKKPTPAY
ncbi:MAG: phytanoyl-CoA dioxygenase family protein [Alphaproteobacteria bacterium]|nr:phytanoyl-CoA dioxygenase family protein [Alphaproteobacteria bacterium]MBV8408966.1 phytanoyl-CoA dioxygenase family protein [Alphaproteobacteria bacterium]